MKNIALFARSQNLPPSSRYLSGTVPNAFRRQRFASRNPALSLTNPGNGGNRVNRPQKFRRPSGGTPGMGMDLKQTPGIPTVPGVKPREQETMRDGRSPKGYRPNLKAIL